MAAHLGLDVQLRSQLAMKNFSFILSQFQHQTVTAPSGRGGDGMSFAEAAYENGNSEEKINTVGGDHKHPKFETERK